MLGVGVVLVGVGFRRGVVVGRGREGVEGAEVTHRRWACFHRPIGAAEIPSSRKSRSV